MHSLGDRAYILYSKPMSMRIPVLQLQRLTMFGRMTHKKQTLDTEITYVRGSSTVPILTWKT